MGLCALLFITLGVANPVHAQSLSEVQQSVGQGVSDVVNNFDINKLAEKPQRDLLTLAIGGIAGYAAGSFFRGLGLLNVEVLGLAIIPIIGGVAGLYLANEGYFDGVRGMVGESKP